MTLFDRLVIAIDGPAASGKSTVARRVAAELNLVFVSSGAMYRAFTWWALENEVDVADEAAVAALLSQTVFTFGTEDNAGTISVSGHDITPEKLSHPEVNRNVSAIATHAKVRERLVAEQRRYAEHSGVVMEGRDIGSVVFPDADYKFYIDASPEVREQRRRREGITDPVAERDKVDSTRKTSPLVIPEGAVVVDSSHLSIEEVVDAVLSVIRKPDVG